MANSEVSICNNALRLVGEKPITSLQDATARARLCLSWYEITRDAFLEEHPWNFTIARASLSRLTDVPSFGFNFAYQLPNDYLRMLDTSPIDASFTIENDRQLLTDETTMSIKYIKIVTDPLRFSMNFTMALQTRLALQFTNFITARTGLIDRIAALEDRAVRKAKQLDGQEQYPTILRSDDLIDVRIRFDSSQPEKDTL